MAAWSVMSLANMVVLGAAAGCAMGYHSAQKKEKQEAAQTKAASVQQNQVASTDK